MSPAFHLSVGADTPEDREMKHELASYICSFQSIKINFIWEPLNTWNRIEECTDRRSIMKYLMRLESLCDGVTYEVRISCVDTGEILAQWSWLEKPDDGTVHRTIQKAGMDMHWGKV